MEDNQNKLQFELKPEVAEGTYANLAVIAHSPSEFVIDFARILPGLPKAMVQSRVILCPEHAKRLLMALQDNINKYEANFGMIDMEHNPHRTIAPFGDYNKGEA